MPSEQRHRIRQLAPLIQGNDSEGATTRRIPIDRQILGVDLHDDILVSHEHSVKVREASSSSQDAASSSACASAVPYLDKVGIPRITADAQVIVAKLLSCRLSKYMACDASNVSNNRSWQKRRKKNCAPMLCAGVCISVGEGIGTYGIWKTSRIDQTWWADGAAAQLQIRKGVSFGGEGK